MLILRLAMLLSTFNILMFGCRDQVKKHRAHSIQPDPIGDYFVVKPPEESGLTGAAERAPVGIQQTALGKEFLLQASMIAQVPTTHFHGLKSRIVTFRASNETIYMLEAAKGHSVSEQKVSTIALASFPIVERSGDGIFFDFNQGMAKLFTTNDWYAHDLHGKAYPSDMWNNVDLADSFLERVQLDPQNRLTITQVAQVKKRTSAGTNEQTPITVRYYLSLYKPDPHFTPTPAADLERVGFFEVNPLLRSGGGDPLLYATKFHSEQPIVFSLSERIPTEYRQAVRDGVLYWNKALGKTLVSTEDAPADRHAPDIHLNLIDWIDWPYAGYAYADAQMDPRTGQILHGQIFLSSAFAFKGTLQARKLLRRLSQQENELEKSPLPLYSLEGFHQPHLCVYRPDSNVGFILERLLEQEEISDEQVLKLSQDYVREVTAHEVGHTLGLRHNFAGSLAGTFPQHKKKELFKQYLNEGKTPEGVKATSSIMDYERFEEAVFTGDTVARSDSAFDYDRKAIRILYNHESFAAAEMPLFCTDSHIKTFNDCKQYDSGRTPFEYWRWYEESIRSSLPYLLIEAYIDAKAPPEGTSPKPLRRATLDPQTISNQLLAGRPLLLEALTQSNQFLQVRRRFEAVTFANEEEVINQEHALVDYQVENYGGFGGLFARGKQEDYDALYEKFTRLLTSSSYQSGVAPSGKTYAFTAEEIEIAKAEARRFFNALKEKELETHLSQLNKADNFADFTSAEKLVGYLEGLMRELILSSKGSYTTVIKMGEGEKTLELPNFVYADKQRLAAATLLAKTSANVSWGKQAYYSLKVEFAQLLIKALTNEVLAEPYVYLKDEKALRWAITNKEIYVLLKRSGSTPSAEI